MKTIKLLKFVIFIALIFTLNGYNSLLVLGAVTVPIGPDGPNIPEPKVSDEDRPPVSPNSLNLIERTSTSISLKWRDRSSFENGYRLERKSSDGGWEIINSWSSVDLEEISYNDEGLAPDTLYSYRVQTFNDIGKTFSPRKTIYTRDGNAYAVWRAEITLHTSNIDDANTDDGVSVSLNAINPDFIPTGNITWLDYGRNDFEKGDEFTYNLLTNGISELGDITLIDISKTGTNGLCLEDITLKVNGFEVYSEDFSDNASGCQWIDNGDGHLPSIVISHEKLRNHTAWSNYNQLNAGLSLLVSGIPNEEMTSRLEGAIGHGNHFTALYWGHLHGPAVEITSGCPDEGENCKTLHVDIDLAADVNNLPDPEVDIDLDIAFECTGEGIVMTTTNIDIQADSDWFWEVLSLGTINFLDNKVEDEIRSAFKAMPRTIGGESNLCVFVNSLGDIIFKPGETENVEPAPTPVIPTPTPNPTPSSTPAPIEELTLSVNPKSLRSTLIPKAVIVTALNQEGNPMSGVRVTAVTSGRTTTARPSSAVTRTDGTVRFNVKFGNLTTNGKVVFSAKGVNVSILQE